MTKDEASAMLRETVRQITDAGFVVTRGHLVMTPEEFRDKRNEHRAKIAAIEEASQNDPATIRASAFAAEQRAFFDRANQ